MKKSQFICIVFALIFSLLTGCANQEITEIESNITNPSTGSIPDSGVTQTSDGTSPDMIPQSDSEMFTDRDRRTTYDETDSVLIRLDGDTATASSNSVQISGSTVKITEEATYILSGTLNNGMIVVDAPDTAKLQIVLNGVSITSDTSAALYILEADKVFLTLAQGSTNTLSNGGTFTPIDDNNIDAAIFSKQDLTINGSGSLTVNSPAGHGIVGKDDLVITGGSYTVNAASHGIEANDSVRITGDTTLTVDAGKDGIHCENDEDSARGFVYISAGSVNIEAEGDGISAGAYLQITDGSVCVLSGGGSENGSKASSDSWGGFMGGKPGQKGSSGSNTTTTEDSTSMKGMKAVGDVVISGGSFQINSADDSIHSNASITISGGTFELASGDDGVHADDTLTVTAGNIHISESYEGLEAQHLDIQGGSIQLVAADDGLNAAGGTDSSGITGGRDGAFGGRGGMGGGMSGSSNGTILISGGELYINASGDGIDSNGSLEISGGYTVVVGPTQGDTSTLDYDTTGVITGGTFIGTGASRMAQTFSNSQQGVIALSVGSQAALTQITVKNANGSLVFDYAPELPYEVVILSSPDLISGETYTITVGSLSGSFQAN
ncbi:MAG: carbohydrate-binding domain-containing protein [Faecousia sp.]